MTTNKLKRLLADDALVRTFITVFLEDVPHVMDKLRRAIVAKDYTQVATVAHGLKSQLAYFDDDEAQLVALQIEKSADQVLIQPETISNLFIKLGFLIEKLKRDLHDSRTIN